MPSRHRSLCKFPHSSRRLVGHRPPAPLPRRAPRRALGPLCAEEHLRLLLRPPMRTSKFAIASYPRGRHGMSRPTTERRPPPGLSSPAERFGAPLSECPRYALPIARPPPTLARACMGPSAKNGVLSDIMSPAAPVQRVAKPHLYTTSACSLSRGAPRRPPVCMSDTPETPPDRGNVCRALGVRHTPPSP